MFRANTQPEELILYDHKTAYDGLHPGIRLSEVNTLVACERLPLVLCEPLRAELSHFLECVCNGNAPRTDYEFSRRVVGMLEAARLSMKASGAGVDLS